MIDKKSAAILGQLAAVASDEKIPESLQKGIHSLYNRLIENIEIPLIITSDDDGHIGAFTDIPEFDGSNFNETSEAVLVDLPYNLLRQVRTLLPPGEYRQATLTLHLNGTAQTPVKSNEDTEE